MLYIEINRVSHEEFPVNKMMQKKANVDLGQFFSLLVIGHWPIRVKEAEGTNRVWMFLCMIERISSGSQLQRHNSFCYCSQGKVYKGY